MDWVGGGLKHFFVLFCFYSNIVYNFSWLTLITRPFGFLICQGKATAAESAVLPSLA